MSSPPAVLLFDLPGITSTIPTFAAGSGTPTFTRATTAYVLGYAAGAVIADGPTLLLCASGEARFMGARRVSEGVWSSVDANGVALTTGNGASALCCDASGPKGYLPEAARTNLFTYSSDFTDAAWVKTTMTAAKTSTGPDGVANSATRLTATGALATVLQQLAAGASSRTWSVWARRVTGTGTIKLFQGATKTADLASLLNTSTYVNISQNASVDITLLGAGVEIGTDTDAIDVWVGQFEAGAFASSPIPTTTVAVTRNADALTYLGAGNIATTGTMYVEYTYPIGAGATESLPAFSGGAPYGSFLKINVSATTINGFATGASSSVLASVPAGVPIKYALHYTDAVHQVFAAGAAGTSVANAPLTPNPTPIGFSSVDGANYPFGPVRNMRVYSSQLSAAQAQALTA